MGEYTEVWKLEAGIEDYDSMLPLLLSLQNVYLIGLYNL